MKIYLSSEQRAAFAHDRHLAVVANAGAGKTSVLSLRVIWLVVEHGVPLDRIVAITFTTKAAAEMRERIRAYLTVLLTDAEQRAVMQFSVSEATVLDRLRTARADMGQARISTFHSFCSGILRQFGHVHEIDPEATELTSREVRTLQASAVRAAIRRFHAEQADHAAWLYEHLEPSVLESVVGALVASPERLRMTVEARTQDAAMLYPAALTVLSAIPRELITCLFDALQATYPDRSGSDVEDFREQVRQLHDRLEDVERSEPISADVFFEARRVLMLIYTESGTLRTRLKKELPNVDLRASPPVSTALMKTLRGIITYLEQLDASADNTTIRVAEIATHLARQAADTYQSMKRQRHVIDFDDMMSGTVRFLSQEPKIAARLATSIDYLMVDEYQDTNPTQYELVQMLVPSLSTQRDHPTRLFIVGDTKQSIYSFRDADVRLFDTTVAAMTVANHRSGVTGPTLMLLDTSYRMAEPLAHRINALCRDVFSSSTDYDVPYTPLRSGRTSQADQAVGSLNLLVTEMNAEDPPTTDDESEGEDIAAMEREARSVVAHLSTVLANGTLRMAHGGALQPGDVGILARRTSMVTTIARLLHDARIPFEIYGGRSFFSRPEVADLRNLLTAAALPSAQTALLAVLRSPIFRCSDADLFTLRIDPSMQGASPALRRAVHIVHELRQRLTSVPALPADHAVRWVLREAGWYHTLADDVRREQILANVEKVCALINAASTRPGATLYDVLEELAAPTDRDDEAEQTFRVDPNVVKVMTIHASKGLEFGLAMLCDLSSTAPRPAYLVSDTFGISIALKQHHGLVTRAQQYLDEVRSQSEDRRLFYVAITRAKDHAVISMRRKYNKVNEQSGERRLGAAQGIGALLQPRLLDGGAMQYCTAEIQGSIQGSMDLVPYAQATATEPARSLLLDLHEPLPPRPSRADISASDVGMQPNVFTGSGSGEEGRLLGVAVHQALERLAQQATPSAEQISEALNLPAQHEAFRHVRALIGSPLWTAFQRLHTVEGYSLHVEADVAALFNDRLVYGRIDALHMNQDSAIIWDWKTNDCTIHTVGALADHYRPQLNTYSWILLQNPAIHHVTARLVFTALLDAHPNDAVVEVRYSRSDLPTLMDHHNGDR